MLDFDPLPVAAEASARYGTLAVPVRAANRDPRPRKLDLMIAAIASVRGLPRHTRNPGDFAGLDSTVEIVPVQERSPPSGVHQPRCRHSASFGRSAPSVESSPCPG